MSEPLIVTWLKWHARRIGERLHLLQPLPPPVELPWVAATRAADELLAMFEEREGTK